MLLIFKIINSILNNFIVISKDLQDILKNIEGYKTIIFYKNINFSLLIEINKGSILFRYPKRKEKINLLIKMTTRDFINIIFEKKNKIRLDIIGEANIAEIFFNLFNHLKSNWHKIILKKINNNYLNIILRILVITKKRILFNKYYLKKIIFKNLLYENIIISKYQFIAFSKTNENLNQKINLYSEKVRSMESKC